MSWVIVDVGGVDWVGANLRRGKVVWGGWWGKWIFCGAVIFFFWIAWLMLSFVVAQYSDFSMFFFFFLVWISSSFMYLLPLCSKSAWYPCYSWTDPTGSSLILCSISSFSWYSWCQFGCIFVCISSVSTDGFLASLFLTAWLWLMTAPFGDVNEVLDDSGVIWIVGVVMVYSAFRLTTLFLLLASSSVFWGHCFIIWFVLF